jgi:hypothetical protein
VISYERLYAICLRIERGIYGVAIVGGIASIPLFLIPVIHAVIVRHPH